MKMEMSWSAEELLPHSRSMVLVDEALDVGEGWVTSSVRIAEDSLFYELGQGVPAWVGAEYMAQTVGLYAGYRAKQTGEDIKIGLWLGSRRYISEVPFFKLGSNLQIRVDEEWQDSQMGVFNCVIEDKVVLASARLNVYQPQEADAFLKGETR
jgi:predicted hotdog family 3-hydroxylacyl-ACP dehydratase